MKFMRELLVIVIIAIQEYYSVTIKSADKNNISIYKIDSNFKLPKGPIKSQGWIRFSNFERDSPLKPNKFIQNMSFSEQFKLNSVIDLKAEDNVINFIQ